MAESSTTFKKGHVTSKEVRDKISKTLKGRPLSEATKKKMLGRIPWNKDKKNPKVAGENHPRWKGGITPLRNKIRSSVEYAIWRRGVFQRDNYTCVFCGKRGGDMNADHIKPFALFPELRFALDNGRTLCVPCHKSITWK